MGKQRQINHHLPCRCLSFFFPDSFVPSKDRITNKQLIQKQNKETTTKKKKNVQTNSVHWALVCFLSLFLARQTYITSERFLASWKITLKATKVRGKFHRVAFLKQQRCHWFKHNFTKHISRGLRKKILIGSCKSYNLFKAQPTHNLQQQQQ